MADTDSTVNIGNWQLKFGKYKGKTFHEVYTTDHSYLTWYVSVLDNTFDGTIKIKQWFNRQ